MRSEKKRQEKYGRKLKLCKGGINRNPNNEELLI